MQKYIHQLLDDIAYATKNVSVPFVKDELEWHIRMSDKEEDKTAPVRNLQEWTEISNEIFTGKSAMIKYAAATVLHLLINQYQR